MRGEPVRRPIGRIFQGSVRAPKSLGFCFSPSNANDSPKIPQEGEREESLSRGSATSGLEVRSTVARKRLKRGGALRQEHWGVPQTLACHPGSTQPGGTATNAGSRPTAGQKVASSQGVLLTRRSKSQTCTVPLSPAQLLQPHRTADNLLLKGVPTDITHTGLVVGQLLHNVSTEEVIHCSQRPEWRGCHRTFWSPISL